MSQMTILRLPTAKLSAATVARLKELEVDAPLAIRSSDTGTLIDMSDYENLALCVGEIEELVEEHGWTNYILFDDSMEAV